MKILVCFKITKTIIIFLNDRNYYISGIMLYIYVILNSSIWLIFWCMYNNKYSLNCSKLKTNIRIVHKDASKIFVGVIVIYSIKKLHKVLASKTLLSLSKFVLLFWHFLCYFYFIYTLIIFIILIFYFNVYLLV